MDSGLEERAEANQTTKLDRYREQFATWATFAALLVFFIASIAIWGWAVWKAGVYIVNLVL